MCSKIHKAKKFLKMFSSVINSESILNVGNLFFANQKKCPNLKPLFIWQECAYKGEIDREKFENILNAPLSIKKINPLSPSQEMSCHPVYVIWKLMSYEHRTLQEFTKICSRAAQGHLLDMHLQNQKPPKILKAKWVPLTFPIIKNFTQLDAAHFHKLWIDTAGEIPEETLGFYREKALTNNQEELSFLLKCHETKSLAKNCPQHLIASWPLYYIPIVSNISDRITNQFYEKWKKGENLDLQMATYCKLSESNDELRELLGLYLKGTRLNCILNIILVTNNVFCSINRLDLSTILDGKIIHANYPYEQLCKSILPTVVPILASLPILFSDKKDLKDNCHQLVYQYITQRRDEYYVNQNKRLITIINKLKPFNARIDLIHKQPLPYSVVKHPFSLVIKNGVRSINNNPEDYVLYYAIPALAKAHKDLIGPKTFAWEELTPSSIQMEFLRLALKNIKNEIIEQFIAEYIDSSIPLNSYQAAKEILKFDRDILMGSSFILKKIKTIRLLQKQWSTLIVGCPPHIIIDNASSFHPTLSGFKTKEAQEFHTHFSSRDDFASHIHNKSLDSIILAAILSQNQELAWVAGLYRSLHDLDQAIKQVLGNKVIQIHTLRSSSQHIQKIAKGINLESFIYSLAPSITYLPLLFWYTEQLEQFPFEDLSKALEKAENPIKARLKKLEDALDDPELFYKKQLLIWMPCFHFLDEEYRKIQNELHFEIKELLEKLFPNINEKQSENEEIEKQWQDEIAITHQKWQSQNNKQNNHHINTRTSKPKKKSKNKSKKNTPQKNPNLSTAPRLHKTDDKPPSTIEKKRGPFENTQRLITSPPPRHWTPYIERWMTLDTENLNEIFEIKYNNSLEENTKAKIGTNFLMREKARHAFPHFIDSLKEDSNYCYKEDITYSKGLSSVSERHMFLFGWLEEKNSSQYVTFHFICKLHKGLNNKTLQGKIFHRYANHLQAQDERFHIPIQIKNKLFNCEEKQLATQLERIDPLFVHKEENNVFSLFPSGYIEILDGENNTRILLFPLKSFDHSKEKQDD